MENENISADRVLLQRYMTILFLLVSFLSIVGLFLLSKIYWKEGTVAEIQKSNISWQQADKRINNFTTIYTNNVDTPS